MGAPKYTQCIQRLPRRAKKRKGKTKKLLHPSNRTHLIDKINYEHRVVPRSQKILYFSLSKLSRKGIKVLLSKLFSAFFQQKIHANLIESLTMECITQQTQKKENKSSHNTLVLPQCKRMWSIDSSWVWHRKHLLAKDQPLLCSWSRVKALPQVASQAKSTPWVEPTCSSQHLVGMKLIFLPQG